MNTIEALVMKLFFSIRKKQIENNFNKALLTVRIVYVILNGSRNSFESWNFAILLGDDDMNLISISQFWILVDNDSLIKCIP